MSDNNFLSRWSRLKKQQSSASVADESPEEPNQEALTQHPESATDEIPTSANDSGDLHDNSEPAPLTDEDMPEIDSLGEESDYSPFLSPGVSDELRTLALRKLFKLPQFNIVDGLNDYDDDFSKMPALSQAVASKMRSWIHEKQEEVVDEITGKNSQENTQANSDKDSQQNIEKRTDESTPADTGQLEENTPLESTKFNATAEYIDEEDPLGDADLEG